MKLRKRNLQTISYIACGVNNLSKRNTDGSRREKRQLRFEPISDFPENAPPPPPPNKTEMSIEDLIDDTIFRVSYYFVVVI